MIPPITFTLAVSSDALMALDGVAMAIEKLADAIKGHQRGDGADPVPVTAAAVAEPEKPKATQAEPRAIEAPPPTRLANAVATPAQADPSVQRPSVPAVYLSPWTDARKAILQRVYPTIAGPNWKQDLREMLLAEDGPPLPSDASIVSYAGSAMKLRRAPQPPQRPPVQRPKQVLVVPVPPRAPIPQPQAAMERLARAADAVSDDAVSADYETIQEWADGQRMPFCSGDDLRAINVKRVGFGLPPFKLSPRWAA